MCLCPDLVEDGGVGRQNNAMLYESHPDPPGWPQLFLCSFKPVALQLKVTFEGSGHSTRREVQLPETEEMRRRLNTDSW